MISRLGGTTSQQSASLVRDKQHVGRVRLLAALIANSLPATFGQRVGAIELDAGQVEPGAVLAQQVRPGSLETALTGPFVEVVKDG